MIGKHPLVEAARRWVAAVSVPLSVFAITRAGLFLLVYLSLTFLPMNQNLPGAWRAYPNNLFLDGWARWDSSWYKGIAENGYSNLPLNELGERNTVFFPLYPLTIRVLSVIIPDAFLSGMIISNVAFLMALIVLYRLIRRRFDASTAGRSIVLLAVYPFSFFFSAVYTESLFLLAVVCAFYFGERKQWVLAGLSAAAAGATRVVGTLTTLALVILYLEQISFDWRKIRPSILWLLLGLLGLGGFMAFLAVRFGDPLEFVRSQYAGYWGANGIQEIIPTIRGFLSVRGVMAGQYSAGGIIHLSMFGIAIILSLMAWQRLGITYAVWSVLTTLASFSIWVSMGRYVAVVFPIFIVAALILRDERKYQFVVYVSILLLALFSIVFAHFYWIA